MLDNVDQPQAALLAGRYELTGVLGVGGMGSVYRARDRELDEVVAVKVLRRELIAQPGILDRFRREVKLARRVTHTNVARVFDIGEHDGEKFITMEFVDGESLGARLLREGAFPIDGAVAMATAIGEALAAAHAAGVVHRDLKPDNVMLSREGRVIVTDFGIARAMESVGEANRTAGGIIVGTPQYMAPEQVVGGPVDERTDIYAWGLVLYELLTGEPAWTGESPLALAAARMVDSAPDPRALRPGLAAPLCELVLKMLARSPAQRMGSAREVLAVLAALGPSSTSRPLRQPSQRPRSPAARQIQRIAVVPLACEAGDERARAIAFGISELVAEAIDGRPGIDVRARGARLARRANRELPAIGVELDTPLVVGGRLEGDVARLTLVNARDGFTLWSRAFPSAARDPFGAAYDAAREIAQALLVPADPPPAAPPSDAKTAELLLRARYEMARASTDGEDRAVALLERAFSRAPTDPWVNAAYALALARRLADTEFPGDATEALAMARQAVERAPRMATTHQSLAEVLIDRGDLVEAARSASLARVLAPGNADVERIAAHLYIEAGALAAGASLLRSASSREVATWRAIWDEARTLAAEGRSKDADDRIDHASDVDPLSSGPWLGRVRCALFRGDLARCESLRTQLGEVLARDREPILAALDAVLGRAPLHAALGSIEAHADSSSCSRQRADALGKLAVDVAGITGEPQRAASLLGALGKRGLVDLPWLAGSSTLVHVRATAAFVEVHEAATRRASRIRAALEGPHETVAGDNR